MPDLALDLAAEFLNLFLIVHLIPFRIDHKTLPYRNQSLLGVKETPSPDFVGLHMRMYSLIVTNPVVV
jgi:hypothetical protein